MRLLPLLFLSAGVPALAQFSQLATTSDGSQVLFVTNLRQHDASQTLDPKLFRSDDAGISHLFTRTTCDQQRLRGPCRIGHVQTSGDGSLVAFQGTTPCQGGSSCQFRELTSSTLFTPAGEERYGGGITISRNGRFLLNYPTGGPPTLPPAVLYDRQTGEKKSLSLVLQTSDVVRVTGDGAVVASYQGLIAGGSQRQLPIRGPVRDMDENARVVVWQETSGNPMLWTSAYVTEIASGRTWLIGPSDRESFDPRLSADGEWILYTSRSG